jgi:hypothetical protein
MAGIEAMTATLNECIVQHADNGSDAMFLRQFAQVEVYLPIESYSGCLKDGPLTVSPGSILRSRTVQLENAGCMILCYTHKKDARLFNAGLSDKFGGMSLIKVAEMVCKAAEVDGLLIQSDGDAWFGANKLSLRQIFGIW